MLIDVYRNKDKIVVWENQQYKEYAFQSYVYSDTELEPFLHKHALPFKYKEKKTYMHEVKTVLEIPLPNWNFEQHIKWIERETKHRIPLYNADIPPEQQFLYENKLTFFENANKSETTRLIDSLRIAYIEVHYRDGQVRMLKLNEVVFSGREKELLMQFVRTFITFDPDIICIKYAFLEVPRIVERLQAYNLECPFHRWHATPIQYKGGKSYYSYGQVRYQDHALRLRGRLLVDTSTPIASQCSIEALVELCQLSHQRFQHLSSRSFGAVFQFALLHTMYTNNILIPYKEKPIDTPIELFDLLKADRVGHTFDPKVGFHKNVAEIDYSSMFPWLMYNHNISAEKILSTVSPRRQAPGIHVMVSEESKGLVPLSIKPFLDRRMYYKKTGEREKSQGLKYVLVSSYGYLRFREFKLGLASSHMALGAYARESLLQSAETAQENGFEVLHGIIDSLYIRRAGMTKDDILILCSALEERTHVPVSYEGIFKWIVFCSSVVDEMRPLPSRYFGVFTDGTIKARGIEVRQASSPTVVKDFQMRVLHQISKCSTKKEIIGEFKNCTQLLKRTIHTLYKQPPSALSISIRVSKDTYTKNSSQKKIIAQLNNKKISVKAGQTLEYIFGESGVLLPEDYLGKPDVQKYKKLLIRALHIIFQQFGKTKQHILRAIAPEHQTTLYDFIRFIYMPVQCVHPRRKGLSEKLIRRKLEREGWLVWRGGSINILKRKDIYPNVQKKYLQLYELLDSYHPGTLSTLQYIAAVHHGMPDFVCYRNEHFKFVECKLEHEQLSSRQKKCIPKLRSLGFNVEVYKLVNHSTHLRAADVNIHTHHKVIRKKQLRLTQKLCTINKKSTSSF